MTKLSYQEKKEIADAYLQKKIGMCWDDLADINSLHDVETEEEIISACDDRCAEDCPGLFDD